MRILSMALVLSLAFTAQAFAQGYKGERNFSGHSITGRIVWPDGTPSDPMMKVAKNGPTCCGEGQEECEKPSGRLVVNPENRGLKNAVVFLSNYPLNRPGKRFERGQDSIDQVGCKYEPHVAFVEVGKNLNVKNSDDILHNVHAYFGSETEFNLAMPLPARERVALKRPGVIELRCDAGHTWMTGWVFVIEHPYYVATDENGNFTLDNVPPGAYELTVWHEGWEFEALRNEAGEITGYNFAPPQSFIVRVEVTGNVELGEVPFKP